LTYKLIKQRNYDKEFKTNFKEYRKKNKVMNNTEFLSEYYVESIYNMILEQDTHDKKSCLKLAKELSIFLVDEIKNSQSPILNQTLEQYKYTQQEWDSVKENIQLYGQK
jgi:hypothetical protein